MAEYRVNLTRSAEKSLDRLNPDLGRRILSAIQALESDSRPPQCRKLSGSRNAYRLRVGQHRILYEVSDRNRSVEVYAIEHRSRVYRRLS